MHQKFTRSTTILTNHKAADPKSLYRSSKGRHFYGTENEIWACFGLDGITEKKNWADYEQLLRAVL
jgi:hypothetical protein